MKLYSILLSFIKLRYILSFPLKWWVVFLQSWASTSHVSNSTGSSATTFLQLLLLLHVMKERLLLCTAGVGLAAVISMQVIQAVSYAGVGHLIPWFYLSNAWRNGLSTRKIGKSLWMLLSVIPIFRHCCFISWCTLRLCGNCFVPQWSRPANTWYFK